MSFHKDLIGSDIHETKVTILADDPVTLGTVASAAGIFALDELDVLWKSNSTTAGDWSPVVTTAVAADASSTVKGSTKLSVNPVSPTNPIAVGDNDREATALRTTGSPVVVSSASAPSTGQILKATSPTAAAWSSPTSAVPQAAYYDVSGQSVSAPTASQVLMNVIFVRTVDFTAAMTGSYGKSGIAATAQTDFAIKQNGTTKVTMRFAASATTATFVSGTAFTMSPGDVMTVVAPASPDATLADISWTFAGAAS